MENKKETATATQVETVRSFWNMECPKCGDDRKLTVTANSQVRILPDGTEDIDGGSEWFGNSVMSCGYCGFEGKADDFYITKSASEVAITLKKAPVLDEATKRFFDHLDDNRKQIMADPDSEEIAVEIYNAAGDFVMEKLADDDSLAIMGQSTLPSIDTGDIDPPYSPWGILRASIQELLSERAAESWLKGKI